MCCRRRAASPLPEARIYGYPWLAHDRDPTTCCAERGARPACASTARPHLTNSSYGFTCGSPYSGSGSPDARYGTSPTRSPKVREVIRRAPRRSCAAVAAAAGRARAPRAGRPAIGAGRCPRLRPSRGQRDRCLSAASGHERIGCSSQGPGMSSPGGWDLACCSPRDSADCGPDRRGRRGAAPRRRGTSAATPVATGVGALLLSAFAGHRPGAPARGVGGRLPSAGSSGWDPDSGCGVDAARAFDAVASAQRLEQRCAVMRSP